MTLVRRCLANFCQNLSTFPEGKAMHYDTYKLLNIKTDRGVAWVTVDNPPINLFDIALIQEMNAISIELQNDDAVRAVVVQSADAEFFIAHADVELIRSMPTDDTEKPTELHVFYQMVERFRTMPKATIGKIAGIARGGGSEFLLSLDMRFAAIGPTKLSQPEVAIGIFPTGSGTHRLPNLLGRARALEVMLGCEDFNAEEAEKYGYINRALPVDELDQFVDNLALRIASYPASAIAYTKEMTDLKSESVEDHLLEEAHRFAKIRSLDGTKRLLKDFMDKGGQTRDVELDLDALLAKLER